MQKGSEKEKIGIGGRRILSDAYFLNGTAFFGVQFKITQLRLRTVFCLHDFQKKAVGNHENHLPQSFCRNGEGFYKAEEKR